MLRTCAYTIYNLKSSNKCLLSLATSVPIESSPPSFMRLRSYQSFILPVILFTLCFFTIGAGGEKYSGIYPDNPDSLMPQDSTTHEHWLTFQLMGGPQYLSHHWDPYPTTYFIEASCQRKFTNSPIWLDAAFRAAFAGELDGEGHRAGPGVTLIHFHAGLGQWWDFTNLPLSVFASGGISYIWAQFSLPDKSKEPQINPAFPDRLLYPVSDQVGHFWGAYARCGIAVHLTKELYAGIGFIPQFTTNRNLQGQHLNINSTAIGLFFGARD
jgi:hypothetical protein